MLSISITPEIEELLRANAPVAVGVSGGKDSQAAAIAVASHLHSIGHTGPRILIHSDLGRVEWKASLPTCELLAAHIGWELITVRRAAGDLMDRWLTRWANNVARYADLSCVKLILPWSTPSMRFCTSELKTSVIASALRKRWASGPIVSVAGIRAEESAARAKAPVSAPHSKLTRAGSPGVSWYPIIKWRLPQVLDVIHQAGIDLHPAYTFHGSSRVSCAFCIMSSADDLMAAAGCADNADLYREMVKLELDSTFAFQGARWLADVAPDLLHAEERVRIPAAKMLAGRRVAAESCIPPELLYVKGWPTFVPDIKQAALIAAVRRDVASAVGLHIGFTDAESVRARYADLFNARAKREAA